MFPYSCTLTQPQFHLDSYTVIMRSRSSCFLGHIYTASSRKEQRIKPQIRENLRKMQHSYYSLSKTLHGQESCKIKQLAKNPDDTMTVKKKDDMATCPRL